MVFWILRRLITGHGDGGRGRERKPRPFSLGEILGAKQESWAKALVAPAGESLEHNTLVAAGPKTAMLMVHLGRLRAFCRGWICEQGGEVFEDRL